MVASGAVGSTVYGLIQPSPSDPRTTLLNADIALQFVPAMLFGVGVGAHAKHSSELFAGVLQLSAWACES